MLPVRRIVPFIPIVPARRRYALLADRFTSPFTETFDNVLDVLVLTDSTLPPRKLQEPPAMVPPLRAKLTLVCAVVPTASVPPLIVRFSSQVRLLIDCVPLDSRVALNVLAVDVGARGAIRRLAKGLVPSFTLRALLEKIPPRVIPWHYVDLLETDPARRVKLKIVYEGLSRLHPADIADIVEDLPPAEREAVFETIDEEVAAEALEEIDPHIQRCGPNRLTVSWMSRAMWCSSLRWMNVPNPESFA